MTPAEAVRKAASIVGTQVELARGLDVSTPTVCQWCAGDRPVPPARAIQIEAITNGLVSREALCPNFPWSEMASQSRLIPASQKSAA